MRIVCPACAATYDVPEGRVLPGRVVRCARCETDWAPIPAAAVPEHEAIALEPEAADPVPEIVGQDDPAEREDDPAAWESSVPLASATDRYATSSDAKHRIALRVAWAATAIVLLAALWLAYSGRDSVMHAWPPSVRAYAALGLARSR